eukprot:3718315-Amphidinium_carterae.2
MQAPPKQKPLGKQLDEAERAEKEALARKERAAKAFEDARSRLQQAEQDLQDARQQAAVASTEAARRLADPVSGLGALSSTLQETVSALSTALQSLPHPPAEYQEAEQRSAECLSKLKELSVTLSQSFDEGAPAPSTTRPKWTAEVALELAERAGTAAGPALQWEAAGMDQDGDADADH